MRVLYAFDSSAFHTLNRVKMMRFHFIYLILTSDLLTTPSHSLFAIFSKSKILQWIGRMKFFRLLCIYSKKNVLTRLQC